MPVLRRAQVVAAVLISVACSDHGTDSSSSESYDRPWATSHPVEGTLQATSGDDVELSWVTDLDVDSEGRIYVGDGMADAIVVLDPDLAYRRNIGRSGDGPGEFRYIASVQVLAGDSVLVCDSELRRITVFDPTGDDVRILTLRDSPATPYWAKGMPRDSGHLVLFSPTYYASGSDSRKPRNNVLRRIVDSPNLADSDSLFAFPAEEALVWRAQDGRGSGAVQVGDHPFGSVPFVAVAGESHVAYATSLALQVTIIDLEAGVRSSFSYETTPIEVTRRQLNAAKEGVSRRLRTALDEGAPYTWPPVVGLVVDDRDQIWMGVRTGGGRSVEWAAFTRDGSHVASILLPSAFTLYVARDDRMVGVAEDELDIPRVQVYRFPDEEN